VSRFALGTLARPGSPAYEGKPKANGETPRKV
jgi:hypothetical protein